MMGWLEWFAHPENTKPVTLVIFFITFALIVLYVYGSKQRGSRLESYKNMPFLEDESEVKETKK